MRWPSVLAGIAARAVYDRDLLDAHDLPDPQLEAPYSIDPIVAAGASRRVSR